MQDKKEKVTFEVEAKLSDATKELQKFTSIQQDLIAKLPKSLRQNEKVLNRFGQIGKTMKKFGITLKDINKYAKLMPTKSFNKLSKTISSTVKTLNQASNQTEVSEKTIERLENSVSSLGAMSGIVPIVLLKSSICSLFIRF